MEKNIVIQGKKEVAFHNQVDYCIGTGRMGLALQEEYQAQLKMVQDAIGFSHIRGHGLFCDDMAIYQETLVDGEMTVEYNFTYLDMVMDSYRSLGLRPFIELGFMPEKMASGTQTVFYWKGNVTPPKDYQSWRNLIQALLRHLMERYGEEEVVTWPVEVWNEPNLPGFWKDADMQEYFKLFKESFEAVKEVDKRFRVGGPAVCGGSDKIWIRSFLEFCTEQKIPLDFVTRHHYATKFPDYVGHYGYAELMDPENQDDGFAGLHSTREIIDSFPEYQGLEIHITEFNTSYIPNCPLHDTNQNAAYIAHQLSRLGDDNESYSYWTFGDIFEERGVPFTPFHGGFGLVANGCIPKPTFWTFVFYKKLKEKQGKCVHRDDNCIIMQLADGSYQGIAWNMTVQRNGDSKALTLHFEASAEEYCLVEKWVDEESCNPLKVWHDIGEPSGLSREQTTLLQSAAQPYVKSGRIRPVNGEVKVSLTLDENAVVYFELKQVQQTSDTGYSYERVMQYRTQNPITRLDYPDPDVIRVEDVYYMVTTTMHFMPGCEILRSYDLQNWEHLTYVYDKLDSTPGQQLTGKENIYGKGMWAASLRYHKGRFYVCFVANDTEKTYLYTAEKIEGPWKKQYIEGFYHDCSLLFEEDDSVYIVYGNKDIYLTQLKEDLSGPKEGGLHRLIVSDTGNNRLGYEGSHFYKINGKYYLFLIHSLKEEWRRVEACFVATSLEGEFKGGDVLNDDMGYCHQGVAQGGIVDTPFGDWYAILFQDRGAVGRIPVMLPITWENDYPVFGRNGKIPEKFKIKSTKEDYVYTPLIQSDSFEVPEALSEEERKRLYGCFGLKSVWQFNHEPDMTLVSCKKDGLQIKTGKICQSITQAVNILTQRMTYPGCSMEVSIDISQLKEGDYAGLCAFQGCYGMIAATRREGKNYLVMVSNKAENDDMNSYLKEATQGVEWESIPLKKDRVRLKLDADFTNQKDEVKFCYFDESSFAYRKLGVTHNVYFKLDHFTGCRAGLFVYATKETGGCATFQNFGYKER